jgi:hypothetical protein
MCLQWHKAQFKLDPHFLLLFSLNALMWWQSRICKFEKPNYKAYNTHLVRRVAKASLGSTIPRPPKDFLAQQSSHFTIFQVVYFILAQINAQICWIIFLDPPHTEMKYHNDIMHHHIFSFVYFDASLGWRNHVH